MDAAQRTLFECPSSVATHLPVATSHTLSVLSLDPDTTRRPSGNTATPQTYDEAISSQKYYKKRTPQRTLSECPSSVATHSHHLTFLTCHTLSVSSSDAETMRRPSGEIATLLTYDEDHHKEYYKKRTPQRTWSECPFSVATHLPVATSHTLSVLSPDTDTTRRPSGNTATQKTYDEARSSQKYSGCRNARYSGALPASALRRAWTGPRLRKTA